MRQKTFCMYDEDVYMWHHSRLKVGDEVILIERKREGSDSGSWSCVLHKGEGVEGNMNHNIKRYHGWRGTTDGVAINAHGVRKVIKVESLFDDNLKSMVIGQKITVGKDLHPEWE